MRRAVGLWQAIMMILLVSGMMIIVLKYASISAKHTRNSFVREQAELFLNSAIEQALLKISLHQRTNGDCLSSPTITSITKRGITYSANIDIIKYYLQSGSDDLDNKCTNNNKYGNKIGVEIGTGDGDSHGMAMFEVEVNATKSAGTPQEEVICRILRRTLQQP